MATVHVLVVPFLTEGHVNGLLHFAQALAAHQGLLVTFAYPARSYALARKRNKLSSLSPSPSFRVEVVLDGLPTAEEQAPTGEQWLASIAITQNAVQLLVQDLTTTITTGSSSWPPVSCIISDTCVPWAQDLADKAGLPRVDFWTSTATAYTMGLHLPELISRGHLPVKSDKKERWCLEAPLIDFMPGLPPFPVTDLMHWLLHASDLSDPNLQFILKTFAPARAAHTILIHSVYELESEVLDAMQAEGFPIYSVGPLFDTTLSSTNVSANRSECLQWLDKRQAASVVYVALGTIAEITLQEIHTMALGLEASGHPFLWVIRADSLAMNGTGTLSESLPDGFLERISTEGKGFIVPWAPQTEVLRHPCVGAFLSHCGWNSTLECLWEGLPVVAFPRQAEQRSNARSIVERWKVGVELERQEDGTFTTEAVQDAVQEIMANEETRQRALVLKRVVRCAVVDGGSSHTNLVNFVKRLHHDCGAH